MDAMANEPAGLPPGPHSGRLDIVLNRHPKSYWVRCRVDDRELFGYEEHGGWATVTPGPHKITCEARTKQSFGAISQVHHIAPGQNLVVFYAPPTHLFGKGSMGLTPQQPSSQIDWREVWFTVLGFLIFLLVIGVLGMLFGS